MRGVQLGKSGWIRRRRKYWLEFAQFQTGLEFISAKKLEAKTAREKRRVPGRNSRPEKIDLNIELSGGADYIAEHDVYLLLWIEKLSQSLVYSGKFQYNIELKGLEFCSNEVGISDPFDYRAKAAITIIAVRADSNEFISFTASETYPIFAWQNIKVDLYPWGETTLDPRTINYLHVYPTDTNAINPDRYVRKSFGTPKAAFLR